MRLYVWIAVAEESPTIVVACRRQENMHAAIRARVAEECQFEPTAACCPAHELDQIERYLLAHGYERIVVTTTPVGDA